MATTPQNTPKPAESTSLSVADRQFLNLKQQFHTMGLMRKIELALPRGIDASRYYNVALTEIRRSPGLAECSLISLAGSIVQAAQVGLELDRNLGQAWLIPYMRDGQKECELQFGYRGLIQLAWRTDKVKSLYSRVVHEGEYFEYQDGTERYLRHQPNDEYEDQPIIFVYAMVHYTNGGTDFVVMSRKAVEKRRARSKFPDSKAWKNDWAAMAMSKPLSTLIKRMPVSTENESLVKAAYLAELSDSPDVSQNNGALIEAEPAELPTRSTTQDFKAGAASQNKVSNLSDMHAQPKTEGTGVASDPSQAPENNGTPRHAPAPAPTTTIDEDWEKLGESPTTKRSDPRVPEPQGLPLEFDAKYGDG